MMERSLAFALLATWGFAAHAGSGGEELSIHSRSLAAASALAISPAATKMMESPATGRPRDVLPEVTLREEIAKKGPSGGCETSGLDVCYDLKDGRIVYKPARHFMPEISGLRAESISLRHDRVILKYSFR